MTETVIYFFAHNYMNFFELDGFVQKLVVGENDIVRNSKQFLVFKEDSIPSYEVNKMLDAGKIAYPYVPLETDDKFAKEFYLDNKPLGYPFDRPVSDYFYLQPNMYFEDVVVYHEGEDKANYYNIPGYTMHDNVVPKH
ncbi:Arylphorin [Eumeta japonica]|uniref:Arylphorin n=1 Tax=Eumeta variegata TaxID=151549 RepID=A0A4C1UZD3_EUMVA|nr:Arylphorin [Eumeta japonica]